MLTRSLWLLVPLLVACDARERSPLASADDRYTIATSFHDGRSIQLTVRDRDGEVVDEVQTGDTDAMKWVTGWVDNQSYLFWGSDTGTAWVRRLEGRTITETKIEGVACARLEKLFEEKFGQHRGNCLK